MDASESPALTECLKAGLLCNDSLLLEKEGRWAIQGDPTEGALLVSAVKVRAGHGHCAKGICPASMQFLSSHSTSIWPPCTTNERILPASFMSRVLWKPSWINVLYPLIAKGSLSLLDAEHIKSAVEEMAAKGLRVLAFAKGEIKEGTTGLNHLDVASGMTFLGLQGMIDPPRQEVILAVQKCHTAGIRVKMITGDHALTASSIAQQVGLQNPSNVVTGKALMEISDRELIDVADRTSRYSPG